MKTVAVTSAIVICVASLTTQSLAAEDDFELAVDPRSSSSRVDPCGRSPRSHRDNGVWLEKPSHGTAGGSLLR
jgi:hypothetical protein